MNEYYWFLIAFLVIGAIFFCYCLCGWEKTEDPDEWFSEQIEDLKRRRTA